MIACFGVMPMLMNVAYRVIGRNAIKIMPFPTQQFLNESYEGYPWLPHYVFSYATFTVLLGTALSTTMPIGLFIVSASCFIRYAMDRGHHLLRVYQKPVPVNGALVRVCVRTLPTGLQHAPPHFLCPPHHTSLGDTWHPSSDPQRDEGGE